MFVPTPRWAYHGVAQALLQAGDTDHAGHFPGHPVLEGVPATEDAYVPLSMDELRPWYPMGIHW